MVNKHAFILFLLVIVFMHRQLVSVYTRDCIWCKWRQLHHGETAKLVKAMKYLASTLDNTLSFSQHTVDINKQHSSFMLKLRNLSVQPLHILVCCHDCSALCTLHTAVFTVLFVLPRINFPHSHTNNWPSFSLMRSIFSSHLFTLDIINVNACEGVVDFLDKEIRGLSPSIFGILKAHDRAAVSLMINANTLPTAIYVWTASCSF